MNLLVVVLARIDSTMTANWDQYYNSAQLVL